MAFLAHAYVGRGNRDQIPEALARFERAGVGDADLYVRVYDDLGIDDARDLRDRAALKGFGGPRLFLVAASTVTAEAQNALLKTLEEPPADAIFALIVPAPETLLPTLRSRMQPLPLKAADLDAPIDARQFLAADRERRIEMLKAITAADEKDTAGTLAFLAALERELAAAAGGSRGPLAQLYAARKFILDKGALRKALLESVALAAPRA